MLVAQNKLGRTPTLDELTKMITETPEQAEPEAVEAPAEEEPKILHVKAFYGMRDKKGENGTAERKPDPAKVLYYQGKDGRVFDCGTQTWLDAAPAVLEHLPSRALIYDSKGQDILRAISSGVVDDEDFSELDKMGAVNDDARRVYQLYKKAADLHGQLSALEKSDDVEIDGARVDPEFMVDASLPDSQPSQSMISKFYELAGVAQGMAKIEEEFGPAGVNLFEQILQSAMSSVDEKTRQLVREELELHMGAVVDTMEALARHVGLDTGASTLDVETDPELTELPISGSIEDEQ
jgi:hypothetical protein